jgi:hypothetical protein
MRRESLDPRRAAISPALWRGKKNERAKDFMEEEVSGKLAFLTPLQTPGRAIL